MPFIVASKPIKDSKINLTKEVEDLYNENYKTLMKEIKEDINKLKNSSCIWIGRISVTKEYFTQSHL